jgi:hypothetical protein
MRKYIIIITLILILISGCGKDEIPKLDNNGVTNNDQDEKNEINNPDPEKIKEIGANELGRIMIIEYHVIGEEDARWARSYTSFRQDLEKLYNSGYVAVSLKDMIQGNIDIPAGKTPVVITFDDGTQGQFRYIENEQGEMVVDPKSGVGVLENFYKDYPDFGLEATFFVNYYSPFGQGADLSKRKITHIIESGMDIGNHSVNHLKMNTLSKEEAAKELALIVKMIKDIVPDYEVETLALPFGIGTKETLAEAVENNPECKVLVLTFPNYYGIRYKYKEIFRIAKENNLQIIIDEAHGAHFNFMKEKFPNAITLGAHVVVQSWHKTLPVLNQGSVLLEGEGLESFNFRENINMFQTTSPSYLIMSSLDAAADFLEGKNKEIILRGEQWQEFFRKIKLRNLIIFRYKEEEKDPFKLIVLSKKESGTLFWEIVIDKYKIQPEIIEQGRLLFMLPLFFDGELAERINNALLDLDNNLEEKRILEKFEEPERKKILTFKKTPQEMSYLNKEKVSLKECVGKICAQKIVMYPPGVPLIYPGEVLSEEIVCYLNRHKINYSLQEGIEIFSDQENLKCADYL